MSVNCFKFGQNIKSFFAALAIVALLMSAVPTVSLAQESGDGGESGETVDSGDSGGDTGDGGDGESTGSGEGGSESDGDGGEGNAEDGEDGESIPVYSENNLEGDDGEAGDGGDGGEEGGEGEAGEEEITGGQTEIGDTTTTIRTGDANARGELTTDANSVDIRSERSATSSPNDDFDDYTLTATGTNQASVDNDADIIAVTGENLASTSQNAQIETGNATAMLNIANILNTNIINSQGFMYLLNQVLEQNQSLDLSDLFFPDEESLLAQANQCTLLSCAAENILYNILNENEAGITNDATIQAITGRNEILGKFASISTGDAYAAGNFINVANTNIIDSNYRLLTVNAIGDLNGDLILPTEDLFKAFFGTPNGMTRVGQQNEELSLNAELDNHAEVNNNVNTDAESGANHSTTTLAESVTNTGKAEADSNIHNIVNQNLFGGDSMFMQIKVHGAWNGNVYGLPAGLTWAWTSDGIIIYNEDAEITPSEILGYDIDSYRANFENHSTATIDNNIDVLSVTGENLMEADLGVTETGDAYAGANVLNIANTNVIGRNWVMAILNIFGDFNGDVSFGQTDLWVGGQMQAVDDPVGPGTRVIYTYTVKNNGNLKASGIEFRHNFSNGYMYHWVNGLRANSLQVEQIDDLEPGESIELTFEAIVDGDVLPNGSTDITASASVSSDEPDRNYEDNIEELTLTAENGSSGGGGGGGSSDDDSDDNNDDSNSEDDDSNDDQNDEDNSDDDDNNDSEVEDNSDNTGGGGGGGGGGGSSNTSSSKKNAGQVLGEKIDRETEDIDPNAEPNLKIYKSADIRKNRDVKAGSSVDYTIIVKNNGGTAYDATVYDKLTNPIGTVISEQNWDLGNVLPGEVIELTYTIKYREDTPSGEYINNASIVAYEEPNSVGNKDKQLKVKKAVHNLTIDGVDLAIRNVGVLSTYPMTGGKYGAIITWETSKATDGQVFLSPVTGIDSPYNPLLPNYGYQMSSFRMPFLTTRHFIFVSGLSAGTQYDYRIRSVGNGITAMGGDYVLTVPGVAPAPQVAGVSTTAYTPAPTPRPAPTPAPAPEPKPEPVAATNTASSSGGLGGIVTSAVRGVFGLFR